MGRAPVGPSRFLGRSGNRPASPGPLQGWNAPDATRAVHRRGIQEQFVSHLDPAQLEELAGVRRRAPGASASTSVRYAQAALAGNPNATDRVATRFGTEFWLRAPPRGPETRALRALRDGPA